MQLLKLLRLSIAAVVLSTTGLVHSPALAQSIGGSNASFDIKLFERLEWRSIGPANMGGRTADVEGVPGDPSIVYVATASGGLWKTTNAGISWTPIFERQGTLSIGDIALAPGNPDVIWVGTGEANTRNSMSFGDGVYRSNDGGATWQHLGLRETERISRIILHPHNPDVAYVAAVGRAFGPNEERGVFMTVDGGKTWQKTLYIDRNHGAADLDMDPANPNILYAGMWQFERKPWTFRSGGENGGVFRSVDGGRTWKKLTDGLPKLMGRIGVKVAPTNSNVVYVIVESKEGILYRSDNRGEEFKQVSKQPNLVSRGFYYTDLRVDPTNENRVYAVASTLYVSIDGGKTFRSITGRTHIDYHALWIDPQNPKRLWQGQDGGVAVSYDYGERWEYVNNFPAGQFYQIHADNRQPFYNVMGGLQDNGSWTGPARTREPAGIMNDDWRMVSFGDGFYILNHPDDPDLYISESQGGSIQRTNMRNREQQAVSPQARSSGGGPAKEIKYRFNWNSPIIPSHHDKNTLYFGGNIVFKSTDFGKTWSSISPDLTTNDPEKQKEAGGPIATENSTAEYHCTIISLAESPVRAGVIWAGTDDGNIQLTKDGGKNWSNLTKNVSGLPENSPVSHVEPSRVNASTVFASFDRHMLDDFRPYIFKSTDEGRTWTRISGNLPEKAYILCLREDPKNPSLLYAGTELGLYASYNGGSSWVPLNLKNLPNVSVHDIVVHPRDNDLILGTHGRSIVVFDDATPIQKMSASIAAESAHLFEVRPATRFTSRFTRYGIGDKLFTGPNPPYGALVTYYLKQKPDERTEVKLQVLDRSGKLIREVKNIPNQAGLNRTAWDLRTEGPRVRRPPSDEEAAFTGGPRGPQVLPGTYTVKLVVGDSSFERPVDVRLDPTVEATDEDLKAQYDAGIRLRDMQSAVVDGLRALDSIQEQLQQIDKTVKDRMPDASAELKDAIRDHLKSGDEVTGRLARSSEQTLGIGGGMQIAERLSSLFFTIDNPNGRPTQSQMEYLNELSSEFRNRVAEVNEFIGQRTASLNNTLRKHNSPTVIAGKTVELPK
jgi:photosystem II stability/assembly factor-like uncharacterized protein